jgi:hypothetical protein
VLVHGRQPDVQALREDIATVLAPLGLRLSPAKTRVVHMSEGFDFLGFRIQWRRKRGTNQWYVYTFIADRPLKAVKAKIRAMTHRVSQADPRTILTRINQILRGSVNYFRHAVCKHAPNNLKHFAEWRVIRWLRKLHRWRWKQFRRRFTTTSGRWLPLSMNGITLFNPASVTVTATDIGAPSPHPGQRRTTPDGRNRGEPGASGGARRVRRAARGNGPEAIPAPRPVPTQPAVGPPSAALPGRVQAHDRQVEALEGGLPSGESLRSSVRLLAVDVTDFIRPARVVFHRSRHILVPLRVI